jgi:thiol-disulfide isomerase/thioredoxin
MLLLAFASVLALGFGPQTPAPDPEADAFAAAFALKKGGRSEQAALAFEAIASKYPESPRLGEALVEAGIGWFAAGKSRQMLYRSNPQSDEAFAKARKIFARIVADRAGDPSAGRAQYMLGSTALFQGDLAGAEAEYGAVLEKFAADAKYAPKALERRAAVRRHLLQDDLALADLLLYREKYPQGEEADSVAQYIRLAAMNGQVAPKLDTDAWIQGEPRTLADLEGHVVALYFFATWCEKCEKELPFMLELDRRMAPAGLVLVGVLDHSKGQTNESVKKYLTENHVSFATMMDKARTRPSYYGQSIPDLVLIDKLGRVRWHDHPASLADYTLATLLGEEIETAPPPAPK